MSNKDIVCAYFDYMAKNEMENAFALFSQDWCFVGPDGTSMSKEQLAGMMQLVNEQLLQPIVVTILGVTEQGSRVAVEATGYGALKNGKEYKNRYHFLFEVSGKKITAMREYCDMNSLNVFEF